MATKVQDVNNIALVEIDFLSREITLWDHDGNRLTGLNNSVKFAKSSAIGFLAEGFRKLCFGEIVDGMEVND